ncbi:glycosyltransferase [Tumidithrix helvetica]|uniref:glycosyltransferase n=1 Tax=Tumidithrix helvetica TaxID=3457545 RepID=UPI003CC5BB81
MTALQQKAKICLITPGHIGASPRLVRNATALHAAGYRVSVVSARFASKWLEADRETIADAAWQLIPFSKSDATHLFEKTALCAEPKTRSATNSREIGITYVDFLGSEMSKRLHWHFVRVRRFLSAKLVKLFPTENLIRYACGYANPELAKLAAQESADLYIAHQHFAIAAAAWAAHKNKSKFAFDAEDLLADCSAEPVELMLHLERRYTKHCAFISTMSQVAAERLERTNHLQSQPLVLYNTPRLQESLGILAPQLRSPKQTLSIYWFGQTIGTHACADQVLKAMPYLCKPIKLVLRGNPRAEYIDYLQNLAKTLNVSEFLEILPTASPLDMVRLASEHDIALGSQPSQELFYQMAIGNKVFTGMMAGLALALTDTIAHRQLFVEASGCGFLFPNQDEKALANLLNPLLANPEKLEAMKQRAWELAQQKFNWDYGSKILLEKVFQITGT